MNLKEHLIYFFSVILFNILYILYKIYIQNKIKIKMKSLNPHCAQNYKDDLIKIRNIIQDFLLNKNQKFHTMETQNQFFKHMEGYFEILSLILNDDIQKFKIILESQYKNQNELAEIDIIDGYFSAEEFRKILSDINDILKEIEKI